MPGEDASGGATRPREWTDPVELPGTVIEPRPESNGPLHGLEGRRFWRRGMLLASLFGLTLSVPIVALAASAGRSAWWITGAVIAAPAFILLVMTLGRWLSRRNFPRRWTGVVLGALVVPVLALVLSAAQDRSVWLSLFDLFPTMSLWIGMLLISIGLPRRRGTSLHCASCDYEYQRGPDTPERCPECGARWHRFRGLARGVKSPARPVWMVAGAAIMALAFFPAFRSNLYRYMPTGLVIRSVADRGFTLNQMRELAGRTLRPEQRASLAGVLIDKRKSGDYLSSDEQGWLDAELAAGSLPTELVDRYYREMAGVWIVAPAQARVGQPFRVGLGVRDHSSLRSSASAILVIGGYRLDGSEPVGRAENGTPAMSSGLEHVSFGRSERARFPHEMELVPERTGPAVVHLEYWLVVMPTGAGFPVTWNQDGTPAIPAGAPFVERREITRDLVVLP